MLYIVILIIAIVGVIIFVKKRNKGKKGKDELYLDAKRKFGKWADYDLYDKDLIQLKRNLVEHFSILRKTRGEPLDPLLNDAYIDPETLQFRDSNQIKEGDPILRVEVHPKHNSLQFLLECYKSEPEYEITGEEGSNLSLGRKMNFIKYFKMEIEGPLSPLKELFANKHFLEGK